MKWGGGCNANALITMNVPNYENSGYASEACYLQDSWEYTHTRVQETINIKNSVKDGKSTSFEVGHLLRSHYVFIMSSAFNNLEVIKAVST